MRVVVVGAGVVGIASAWYLSKAGHDVDVIEHRDGPALETSFANAAQISPALSAPWAVPGLLRKVLGWWAAGNSPLVIGKLPDREMARWLWQMYKASSPEQYLASKRYMVTLAEYSRDRLAELRSEEPIDYFGRQLGTMVLFRDPRQKTAYEKDLKVLDTLGVPYEPVDKAGLARYEPNINLRGGAIGGVLLPGDETGDCHRFTQELAALCTKRGVRIRYGSAAELVESGGRISAVRTAGEEIATDAAVLATGVGTNRLLSPFGMRAPIYPMKGYSLTIVADSDELGPRSTISDETYKVGLTNLGDRVRVGGTAELAGYDLALSERRFGTLFKAVQNLFPRISAEALSSARRWTGLRPMTPQGPPLVGAVRLRNLFINSGHGTLGWTMACGSGKIVADLVSGKTSEVALPRLPQSLLGSSA